MAILLRDLIKQIPSDTQDRVDQTRTRFNSTIRELIKQETGLMLRRGEADKGNKTESVSVPVKLVPGLPIALQDISFDDSLDLLLLISPQRKYLQSANANLKHLAPFFVEVAKHPKAFKGSETSLVPCANYTQKSIAWLLEQLAKDDPVKKILSVDEDVLGAYYYGSNDTTLFQVDTPTDCKIELYWAVIGLVAGMLGVETEHLTAVVLAHEVAHAYTHLGADIDGHRWVTDGFARTDRSVKEGLAQYYTIQIAKRLELQISGYTAAFHEMLKSQPVAYHAHELWVTGNKPEEVRLAMLEFRRDGSGNVQKFNTALVEAKKRLRKHA
ncbi:MAG: hypothetical protein OEM52_13280 [bacterium]|nr:hypothetical protein [bacterium]